MLEIEQKNILEKIDSLNAKIWNLGTTQEEREEMTITLNQIKTDIMAIIVTDQKTA